MDLEGFVEQLETEEQTEYGALWEEAKSQLVIEELAISDPAPTI